MSVSVDDMVTQGNDITARVYYHRLERLSLSTGAESMASFGRELAACKYAEGRDV